MITISKFNRTCSIGQTTETRDVDDVDDVEAASSNRSCILFRRDFFVNWGKNVSEQLTINLTLTAKLQTHYLRQLFGRHSGRAARPAPLHGPRFHVGGLVGFHWLPL